MLSDRFIHLGKKYSALVIAISLLSHSFSFNVPLVMAEETSKDDLLQFTSQNHILGFRSDGVYIASTRHALTTKFLDANTATPVSDGSSEVDSSGKVPALGTVTYKNIWDGIDAVYEGGKGVIVKSTYTVDTTKKGVTADNIRLQYNRPVHIDANGNLQINFEDGMMTEEAPIAWQETPEGRQPVAVSFKILEKNIVGFTLGDYLPNIPLVIDPSLTWNTFAGGSGTDDDVLAIEIDSSGNVYVGGYSDATWGTPVRAYTSGYDALVAKFDSEGALMWNTFLGSTSNDYIFAIVVDSSGNVYVGGSSNVTWGSPIRAHTVKLSGDGFAAKLNSSGTLIWNTFLGAENADQTYAIELDSSGNVYVGGYSSASWGSPVMAYTSGKDAFVAKLDSDGALTWNTFLGTTSNDYTFSIAVDNNNNVYVGGYSSATWGSPVREFTLVSPAATDGVVVKLDSSGTLIWNTFLGGVGTDKINSIAIDSSRNVYVGGYSDATWGSPVLAYTSGNDAVVAKLSDASTASTEETTDSTPEVVIRRGGGRGSKAPGRGGTAPMIDLKTMRVISTTDSPRTGTAPSTSPEEQRTSHPTQQSSPAVLLLQNQRTKLLTRIEKKIETALTSAVRKMFESNRERVLKRINAKIQSLLRAS